MLLLSLLLLITAGVVYTQVPSMLIYWTHPLPVYLLLAASVACAVASRRRGVMRWLAVGGTGLVTALFVIYAAWLSQLAPHQLAVKPGDAFPDFRLQTSAGDWFAPADLKGKKAALYIFYRGDW